VTFAREKRLLLGALALLAPLPLPFNGVTGWVVLLVYWSAVGLFLWRTVTDTGTPLPIWAMNALGVAYLPVLVIDFVLLWQSRLLSPLIHLALFSLAVKLFGMKMEKDKWHILLLIFFTFMAAMGSSVHPAMIFYLAVFLAASILVLARFAAFHVLGTYGVDAAAQPSIPLRGFVATSATLTLIGAIPLFILLPRLGSPYVMGPGGSLGTMTAGAGLNDSITLDVIGRVRTSRAVAMRVSYENPPPEGHEGRFRAAVYSEFRETGWARENPRTRAIKRERDGFFHLVEGRPRSWVEIWLEPGISRGLVLPTETVVVSMVASTLQLDQEGIVRVPFGRGGTLNYRAGLSATSGLRLAENDREQTPRLDAGDLTGVSPAIARLAGEVSGSGSVAEKARRIEQHLATSYQYTLDLVGSQSANPVDDFLFRTRRGHCEYFASAMVLMLRSQGIPARFATGYLGGEYSPFEDYVVVRQSDAHAWVEAYLPDQGWTTFDPTPVDGRPVSGSSGLVSLMSQAYDFLIFRWDRYILTYGFFDQVGFARNLVVWWSELWQGRESGSKDGGSAVTGEESPQQDGNRGEVEGFDASVNQLAPLLVVLFLSGWWIWQHRPKLDAVRAYKRLRSRLEKDETLPLQSSTPPLQLAEHIDRFRPPASAPARRVIELYLRQSFGEQELSETELQELRTSLRDALQNLRKIA
jgi:transglutaminase-like putative cysteine protease